MLDLTAGLKPKTPAAAFIKDADEATFEKEVLEASMERPIIVDFWATWCGPCKQLTPVLEKAVMEAQGAVMLVKVDVDANQGVAQALRVQSVPTVYAFFKGRPVDGFSGAQPESAVRAFVERLKTLAGPPPLTGAEQVAKLMTEADGFFREGKIEEAMSRFAAVLDADGDNMEALGGIGWCLLTMGDAHAARDMLAELTPEQVKSPRLAGLTFILSVVPEADGDDKQTAYASAQRKIAEGQVEQGIDALVALIKKDRAWQDAKAKTFLISVFDALGNAHPLTGPGRRKLSAVLFS